MSEVLLTEQLDQAIEALLAGAEAVLTGEEVAGLIPVAARLRSLPRPEFKERLRREFESAGATAVEEKNTAPGKPKRANFRTVTPYITVANPYDEIDFVKTVFGAQGQIHGTGSEGGIHSEYSIGGSMLMIGGGEALRGREMPAAIHLYVENIDDTYERALQAGAISLAEPTDHPYGERGAAVRDVGGNTWYLATHHGASHVPEGVPNLMPCFTPHGALQMIDFLKESFGAEEVAVHKSPQGALLHASIGIGDSVVELGEAHGQWQPVPMMLMLYVDDVDAWYERAVKVEGAVSMGEPADQPYGDRVAAIKDPFDNVWYIGTPIVAEPEADQTTQEIVTMAPKMFRIAVQVGDLDQAAAFYAKLLNDEGRRIPRGSRHYFDCGATILALVDVTPGGEQPKPIPDYVYFAVSNLTEIYERARAMNCLAQDEFHDQKAGEIVKRPWGELSFYVEDPWGNGLCFVDETTLFTGK